MDWLELRIYGQWNARLLAQEDGSVVSVWDLLERGKEAAISNSEQGASGIFQTQLVNLDERRIGRWVYLRGQGFKSGVYFPWAGDHLGITFGLRRVECRSTRQPVAVVQITGSALLEFGYRGCVERARDVLEALGIQVERESVTRVDIAADLFAGSVDEVVRAVEEKRLVRRSRKYGDCGKVEVDVRRLGSPGRWETVYFGSAPILLRIYDKLRELGQKGDEREWGRWDERWGCVPDCVTRVEFELRREGLREKFGIDTLSDLEARIGDVLGWLTSRWLRFTEKPVDAKNRNQGRAMTWSWWSRVCDVFAGLAAGGLSDGPLVRVDRLPIAAKLLQQFIGVTSTILAVNGDPFETAKERQSVIRKLLMLCGDKLERQARLKREGYIAKGLLTPELGALGRECA